MKAYRRKYPKTAIPKERIVVELPKEELEKIDDWGIPAGMGSRTEAIRHLLTQALEMERDTQKEMAAEVQSPNESSAANQPTSKGQ